MLKENHAVESILLVDLFLFLPVSIGQHVDRRSLRGRWLCERDPVRGVRAENRTVGEIEQAGFYRLSRRISIHIERESMTFIVFSCREKPAPGRGGDDHVSRR